MQARGFSNVLILIFCLLAMTFTFILLSPFDIAKKTPQNTPLTIISNNEAATTLIPEKIAGKIYVKDELDQNIINVESFDFYVYETNDPLQDMRVCEVEDTGSSPGTENSYYYNSRTPQSVSGINSMEYTFVIDSVICNITEASVIKIVANYEKNYLSQLSEQFVDFEVLLTVEDFTKATLKTAFDNRGAPNIVRPFNDISMPDSAFRYGSKIPEYGFSLNNIKAEYYGSKYMQVDGLNFEIYKANGRADLLDWWLNGGVAEVGGYEKTELEPKSQKPIYTTELFRSAPLSGNSACLYDREDLGSIDQVLYVNPSSVPAYHSFYPTDYVDSDPYSIQLPISSMHSYYFYYASDDPFIIRFVMGSTGFCQKGLLNFLGEIIY